MNKKKAVVCTTLFAFAIVVLLIASLFIRSHWDYSLFSVLLSGFGISWLLERVEKFYNWLIKG